MTATASTASDARASLQHRIAERLRFSELDAWRYLTPDDPFDELAYMWLGDLQWDSDVSGSTHARCERVVRTQLQPAFGKFKIRELTAERIEQRLASRRVQSEKVVASSRGVIELLLDFAVGEGVIRSNPMVVSEDDAALSHLGDLDTHREIVRGRIELLRGDQRREMRGADD